MGYIAHHAIVVTGSSWKDGRPASDIEIAHAKAVEICGNLVSNLVPGRVNGDASFFVAPDCSKEGWSGSERGDDERARLIAWMREQRRHHCWLDWALVRYGGDDPEYAGIVCHEGDAEDDKIDEEEERLFMARHTSGEAPALGGLLAPASPTAEVPNA